MKYKKISAFAGFCLAAVMFFSSIAFANDNESPDDGILTVEEALELAIKNSNELKNISDKLYLAEDDAEDANHDLFYATEFNEVKSLSVQLKNLRNSIENYKTSSEVEKQKLELSVIELFTAIKQAESSLELFEKQLDISQRQLELSKVKLGLGLITENEYTDEKNNYNKIKTQMETTKISVDEAYTDLNKLLGKDLDEKYELKLDVEYKPFEPEQELETKILKSISSAADIKAKKEAVEVAKYEVDVYSELYSNDKKESKINNYNQASRSLDDAQTDMRVKITNLYNSIYTIENQYKDNTAELEQMKKELEIKKLSLSLGKITQLELDNYEYNIENLENQIQNQIYQHDILVREYENPDLL